MEEKWTRLGTSCRAVNKQLIEQTTFTHDKDAKVIVDDALTEYFENHGIILVNKKEFQSVVNRTCGNVVK